MSPTTVKKNKNSTLGNHIQNITSTTAGHCQDRSDKEMRNDKIVREFYNKVFFAKNASDAVNYLEEDYNNTIQMSPQERGFYQRIYNDL